MRSIRLRELVREHDGDVRAYYLALNEISDGGGVAFDESLDGWLITSYALCDTLLRFAKLGRQKAELPRGEHPDLVECAETILNSQMMFADGAHEQREFWRARTLTQMDLGERAAVMSIGHLVAGSRIKDLYGDVLQPFASRVASAVLEITEETRAALYPLVWQAVRFVDGKLSTDGDYYASMFALVSLYDRLGAMFRDDELSARPGYSLADRLLMLIAGHESMAYLLATLFINVRTRIPVAELGRAMVEALRFDSPVQLLGRCALAPLSIGDIAIPEGARLFFHIGAANRDPSVFSAPHTFDWRRSERSPISFGVGGGACPGQALAVRSSLAFLRVLDSRECWFETANARGRNGIAGRGYACIEADLVHQPTLSRGVA